MHGMRAHRPWLLLGILLPGLFVIGVFIVLGQRDRDRVELEQYARDDLALLTTLVRNELQLGQYENAVNLVASWGRNKPVVSAIRLSSGNGFMIAEYRRSEPAHEVHELVAPIEYSYEGRAILRVTLDLAGLAARQRRLQIQLLGVWLALAALLTYLTHLWQRRRQAAEALALQARALERANAELAEQMAERARAEKERYRLASVLEATTDMVAIADPDGRFLYMNRSGLERTGLRELKDVEQTVAELHPAWAAEKILEEALPTALETGSWSGETALLDAQGGEIPVSQVILSHRDEAGRLLFLSTIVRDISASKRVEKELKRTQFMVDNAPQEIWLAQMDGRLAYANKAAADNLGYTQAQLLGMSLADVDAGHGREELAERVRMMRQLPVIPPFETLHRTRDGRLVPKEVHATYLKLPDEEYICGFVIDLTERKRTEAALLAGKAQLEEAQAITHLGSWDLDLVTGRASWSKEEFRLLGYEPDAVEASAEHFMACVHPDDRERVSAQMQAATSRPDGAYGIEHRVLLPGHEERILLERGYVSFDAQGNPRHMIGTSLDVTALRRSERRLIEAQRIAHIGSWELDLLDNRLLWSEEIYRIFERDPGDPPESYEAFLSLVHPQDRELVDQGYSRSVRERIPYDCVHRLLMPDGRIKHIHEQCETIHDDQGRAIRSIGTAQDITELKLAEQRLHQHQVQLEALVAERTRQVREQALVIDQIHDAVVTTDMDGLVTSWNAGAEQLFGYSAQEAVGRPIGFVYPQEDHAFLDEQVIRPLLEDGAREIEVRMRRRNGEPFYAQLSLSLLYDERGAPRGMVGYSMDISARKEAELQLQEKTLALAAANRELEAFSYSVSHDLRAPLRGIDGFSQALLEDYGDQLPEGAQDYLRRVRSGAQRMGDLIDAILRLSRVTRVRMEPKTVDLSAVAAAILEEHAREEPERRVATSVAPGLTARGDPGLLQILLENLLGNAWKYTAKTESACIELGVEQQDGQAVYFVRDNGAGFDMQYADKLFGAFQRLHHPGEFTGTGIGLATAQRIVHRHGGRLWAEGAVGRGAVFRFVLGSPRAEGTSVE